MPVADTIRQLALTLYVPSLLVAVGQQAMLIMLPLYALDLGGGPALAAALVAGRGLGTLFADIPSGTAVSRFGDKPIMVGGLLLLALAAIALSLADMVWAAVVLSVVFGAGVGVWMLARLHYVAEHCPVSHRGRALTVLAAIQRVGMFVGPVLGGLTVKGFGYPALFVLAGTLALLGMGLVVVFTKYTPPGGAVGHHPVEAILRVIGQHRRTFARAGTATLLLQFVRSGRQLLVPLWGDALGLDAATIGLVFGVSSIVDICMFYPAGHLMDAKGRKWTAVPSLGLLALSLGWLPFTEGLWGYAAATILSGLGNGFGTGIVMTLGADLSPGHGRGEFLGVWRFIGDAGHAVGPIFMGVAAKSLSLGSVLWITAGLGGVGVVLLVVAVEETLRRTSR